MRILSFPVTVHSLCPSRLIREERSGGKLQAANLVARAGTDAFVRPGGAEPRHHTTYVTISAIVPAPTVCPPSRIANRNPFSIATGVISSITRLTLSPGITISVPAGNY